MIKYDRKYYEAYDERYKAIHEKGYSWEVLKSTPVVMDVIRKYNFSEKHKLLEIGCGEGRDSRTVLENGYDLTAIDCSLEAISYCKKNIPEHERCFMVLDCLSENLKNQFDLIYSIAVIHMLVVDEDRKAFYSFIHNHLKEDGIALIATMGDGCTESKSDIRKAFEITEREHLSGKVMVPATSCRMVSFETFEKELESNELKIIEKGITDASPNFNNLMYAVVKRKSV